MPRAKLTKRKIDYTPCPSSGQIFLRDSEIPGFALRLSQGAKSFVLEMRVNGRPRRVTLGLYGALTLEQARDDARSMIGRIVRGEDPTEQKRSKREEPTFGNLSDLFRKDHFPRLQKSTVDLYRIVLEKHLAAFRNRKLSSIGKGDIARLHAEIYNSIAAFAPECREMAERTNRPISVIKENIERLLHSCRCLARLEEDGHPLELHVTWALAAVKALRSAHAALISRR